MPIKRSPEEMSILTSNFSGRRTPRLQLRNADEPRTIDLEGKELLSELGG